MFDRKTINVNLNLHNTIHRYFINFTFTVIYPLIMYTHFIEFKAILFITQFIEFKAILFISIVVVYPIVPMYLTRLDI